MKIMADAMLGKLGHFLRLLGFDTEIADNEWSDPEVMRRALNENRMLITRDKLFNKIARKEYTKKNFDNKYVLFVKYDEVEKQLGVFFMHMGIDPSRYEWKGEDILPFDSRCTKCNEKVKKVSKEEVIDKIAEGTVKRYNNFYQCENNECAQLYWVGKAHWKDIFETIKRAREFAIKIRE